MGYFVSYNTNYLSALLLFIKYWRMRSHAQQLLTLANETLEKQVKERTSAPELINQKLPVR